MTQKEYDDLLTNEFKMEKRGTGGNFYPYVYTSQYFDYLLPEDVYSDGLKVYKSEKNESLEGSEVDDFSFHQEQSIEEFESFLRSILK